MGVLKIVECKGFTKDEANQLGIKILRMPIIINGECYFENETINSDLFSALFTSSNTHFFIASESYCVV